jgi:Flp pilus assembly protein TadD
MLEHREFVELLRIGHPDRNECVVLYEKVGPNPQSQEARSLAFGQANPKFLPAIMARAYHLMYRGQYKAAVERFDFALASVQNDPDIWYGRGYCMLQLGFHTEAVGNLTNAVRIWHRYPIAWHHLGSAQAATGDLKNALKSMNTSILHYPANDAVFYSRASVRAAMRDYEGAVADYTAAIRINPLHAQAYTDRAAAHSILGRLEAARADIAQAVKMLPNDPKVVFVQGRIEMQAGRKAEGCVLMQKAVDLGLKEAANFIAKNCGAVADSVPAKPQ